MSCYLPTSSVRDHRRDHQSPPSDHNLGDSPEKPKTCLGYLDTLPTNLSKQPIPETWEASDSESEPEDLDLFYASWRRNFERWLLKKNPQKYQEFKRFLQYAEENGSEKNTRRRLYSSSESHSIRDKINQYLVQKPVFDARILKRFRNRSTETMLRNIIKNKAVFPQPQESIKLSPIKASSAVPEKVALPSISEILDVSKSLKHGDRRSISTSSVESGNSVFSEVSAKSYTIEEEPVLLPPLIAYKSSDNKPMASSQLPPLALFSQASMSRIPPLQASTDHVPHITIPPSKTSPGPDYKLQLSQTPRLSLTKKSPKSSASPKKSHSPRAHAKRTCLLCGSSQSPCWRPSWSLTDGQLCNLCGLRYKKTNARCVNALCLRIPAKGEFNLIKTKANNKEEDYKCLRCGSGVEIGK